MLHTLVRLLIAHFFENSASGRFVRPGGSERSPSIEQVRESQHHQDGPATRNHTNARRPASATVCDHGRFSRDFPSTTSKYSSPITYKAIGATNTTSSAANSMSPWMIVERTLLASRPAAIAAAPENTPAAAADRSEGLRENKFHREYSCPSPQRSIRKPSSVVSEPPRPANSPAPTPSVAVRTPVEPAFPDSGDCRGDPLPRRVVQRDPYP